MLARVVELAYDRRGSGPPLLLVHAIGLRRGVWQPVAEHLTARHEVFAIDLPGFGDSRPLPAGTAPTVSALADAVEAFVRDLGLERPAAAGNSLGAGIALELARRDAVRAAVALSPVGFWTAREQAFADRSLLMTARLARAIAPIAGALMRPLPLRSALLWQNFRRARRRPPAVAAEDVRRLATAPGFEPTLRALRSYRFRDGHELRVPVTIAWAEHDRLLLPRQARRARAALPQARHVLLRGCGHVPMTDDPEQVARVVLEGTAKRAPARRGVSAAAARAR